MQNAPVIENAEGHQGPLASFTLPSLLASALMGHADGDGRTAVLIRSPGSEANPLTLAQLDERAGRIAAFLRRVLAGTGETALIALPLGEALLVSLFACHKVGLTPCLVPAGLDEAKLMEWLERLEAPVAIGIGEMGGLRPLLALRAAATASFHLRLAAGFGPGVPDGIADLDLVAAEDAPLPEHSDDMTIRHDGHDVRFVQDDDANQVDRTVPGSALASAAFDIARELRAMPGSRILTCMVGHDMSCIASSFGVGLIAGLEVTPIGVFSLARLWSSLSSSIATHLVVPASLEMALVQTGIARHKALASLMLVHEPGATPAQRGQIAPSPLDRVVIDIWRPDAAKLFAKRR